MLASSMHITINARFGSRHSPTTPSPVPSNRKRRAQIVAVRVDGSRPPLPGLAEAVGTVVHDGSQHTVLESALPDSMVEPSSLAVDSGVPPENFSGAPPVQLTVDGGVPPVQLTVGGGVPPVQLTVDGGVPPEFFSGVPPVQLTVDGGVPPARLTVGGGVPPVQLTVDGGVPPENFSGVPPVQLTDDGGVPPVQCASGSVSNIGSAPITLLGAKHSDSGATQRCADHSALCVSSALLRRSQCGPAACMRSDCVVTQPHVCAVVSVVQPHVCAAAVL